MLVRPRRPRHDQHVQLGSEESRSTYLSLQRPRAFISRSRVGSHAPKSTPSFSPPLSVHSGEPFRFDVWRLIAPKSAQLHDSHRLSSSREFHETFAHSEAPKSFFACRISLDFLASTSSVSLLESVDQKAHFLDLKSQLALVKGSSVNCPPMGFPSLWRSETKPATHAELASLDYAAPSGFLNPLTLFSDPVLTALFHAEAAFGI